MKRLSLFITLIILCTLLTGCWDKVEIDERIFVLGIGIDKASEEEKNQVSDRYLVSFASPIVGALKEGGDGKVFDTYNTAGETFTICLTQMLSRLEQKLSFEHTRVLILGENLVKDERLFREILDSVGRAHEFHKSMYVFVVPDKAHEIFNVEPRYSKLLAMYIAGIADNEIYSARISKMAAHEMYNKLLNQDGSVMIPRLMAHKDEVKVAGLAVIKDYKLIGYISEEENIYTSWVTNEAEGGIITTKYNDISIPFRYNEFKRKIKLDKVENNKIYITLSMETEGEVEEYIWNKQLLEQENIHKMEKQLEKEVVEQSEKIVKKFKDELQVDLIGIRDYLKKFQPDVYQTVKSKYNERFRDDIVINVTADVKIRRVGLLE